MLYSKNVIINMNQELVAEKCFPILNLLKSRHNYRLEAEYDPEDNYELKTNYFTKIRYFVDIKEEDIDIFIDAYESHMAKFHYITINDTPRLYIMPEKTPKKIHFLENNQEISKKIYGVIMYRWIEKQQKGIIYLGGLFTALKWLFVKIYSVAILGDDIKYCHVQFHDLPSEIINTIKEKFFAYHHYEVLQETLHESGYEILEEMALLKKENKITNPNIDIQDFYENNEDFRNRIDKIVEDKLEEIWLSKLEDNNFKEQIVKKFQENINPSSCDRDKVLNILFHNEIMNFLFGNNNNFSITIRTSNEEIKSNIIIVLKNKINIINWLYGSLSDITGFPLVEGVLYDRWEFEYDKEVCKEIYGDVKYYEIEYKEDEVHIGNVIVDCIAPKNCMIYAKSNIYCYLLLKKRNKYLWLHNARVILNRLIELQENFARMIKVFSHINRKTIIAPSIMVYLKR